MKIALIGQANILTLPLVAKATGDPITSGTVNFYLVAKDGTNAGKYYRGLDQTWQSSKALAGTATHRDEGHWYLSFPSAVWTKYVCYRLYGVESGALHITFGEDVLAMEKTELALHTDLDSYANKNDWMAPIFGTGAVTVDYYVFTDEDLETGPIADCKVWVTSDLVGSNIVASGYTNALGKVTFYLDAATYYLWRKKTGYNFSNPDTEVVA